jgi:hypothetical protein
MNSNGSQDKADKKAARIETNVGVQIKKLSDEAFSEISKLQSKISESSNPNEIDKLNKKIGKIQDNLQKTVAKYESVRDSMLGNVNSRGLTTETSEKVGSLIAKKQFGFATVQFYSNGYVSVKNSLPQKLVSIEAGNNTTAKTLPGRAITQGLLAPITGGLSLMTGAVAPRLRGTLSLIIVTEVTAHSLVVETPMDAFVKAMYEIEGIGKALIAKNSSVGSDADSSKRDTSRESTLGQQIKELSELHESGVITDQEFAAAKAKLLEHKD